MERVHPLEVLLKELAQCRRDNGINILLIDGVSEQAIEYIEAIDDPSRKQLHMIKEIAIQQLDTIPTMVKKYKRSFNHKTRIGDQKIHGKCVAVAEHAISDFINYFTGEKNPARQN
ncbi:MAG: hypothetical protein ISR57_06440 [Bacteroidales bacterium]|nr:hypothetical protein [Bacteroidota bacterium]MBL6950265.1 hypothetical protein [Bacteroidales bacterium]